MPTATRDDYDGPLSKDACLIAPSQGFGNVVPFESRLSSSIHLSIPILKVLRTKCKIFDSLTPMFILPNMINSCYFHFSF